MIFQTFGQSTIVVGNTPGSHVQLDSSVRFIINLETSLLRIIDVVSDMKLNTFDVQEGDYPFCEGTLIEWSNYRLVLYSDEIHVYGVVQNALLPQVHYSHHSLPEDYPNYHRSPRIIYRAPEDKVSINYPPEPIRKSTENLLKILLPPLIMMTMSIIMLFLRPNGIYMLATIATTLVSIGFSIHSYIKGRKKYKLDVKEREETYTQYLDEQVKKIHHYEMQQRQGALYHYPSVKDLSQLIIHYSERIYEKSADQFDFLSYRLGMGKVKPSIDIQENVPNKLDLKDPLEKRAHQIAGQYQWLENMPVTIDLLHGAVGYIGARNAVIEQLQWMMLQLATFQSYHDLRFIIVTPEEEYDQWQWLRFLPHLQFPGMEWRSIVYDDYSRTQILNALHQLLKDRQQSEKEAGERDEIQFLPHIVLLITDDSLLLDHSIMEILGQDLTKIGVSLVYVKDIMKQLPETVHTVIDIRDRHTGELVMVEGQLVQQRYQLDHLHLANHKERLPRLLAGLNHVQTLKSAIPESITFLEMYGVEEVQELHIFERWQKHSPYRSLAVPLGVNSPDHLVELNLHEKAHGPHGLIAGTTGSGKSEVIQSYILSLAVNFHPHDVAFLLIDYKGGGMANLFRHLPHLLGTITNLDGSQSMRALISINAELKRRQRLFSENNVNHINQYQKLYKEGAVLEPMPHLFLISDEFAELKSEQPEFMAELISTARIGRSLGIHLILATQKPAGVVDDQIWSNSKFKIALKVAEKADSMEMLKTPDAADITQPGRGYLQVGNNEIYELFQSAYSGADYRPNQQQEDGGVLYRLNQMGEREVVTKDLSGLDRNGQTTKVKSELEAIIDEIATITRNHQIDSLPQPWLPPLETKLIVKHLRDELQYTDKKQSLSAIVGMVDLPEEQAQRSVSVNLSEDGNLAVYSSPGYGKSTFLQTFIMELARAHTPEQLNIYLLDFGTNGLQPLRDLPHVADIMNTDEEEKIRKFMKRLELEVKRRKNLLSQEGVANLGMYERKLEITIPEWVVVIDSFEGFKDLAYEDALVKLLASVTRDGLSVGIHIVVSAGSHNAMRAMLSNNFKVKIALKQNQTGDIHEMVGKTTLQIDDLPGRGLIKLEKASLFQTALPTEGDTDLEVIENLQKEVQYMNQSWTGQRPEPIPMMPEEFTHNFFLSQPSVQKDIKEGYIPIGLDYEKVEAVSIRHSYSEWLPIISDRKQSLTIMIQSLIHHLDHYPCKTIVLDIENKFNDTYKNIRYINNHEEIKQFSTIIDSKIAEIHQTNGYESYTFVIPNIESLVSLCQIDMKEISRLISEAYQVGIYFIIGTTYPYLTDYNSALKELKTTIDQAIFVMRLSDQNVCNKPLIRNEAKLENDEAYYYHDDDYIKFKYC